MRNAEYLLILCFFFAVSVFLEKYYGLDVYKNWKERAYLTVFFLVVGVVWDYTAVVRNHWNFTGSFDIGLKIGVLPVEEYLFALVVPYFIITSYTFLIKKVLRT